ncbi:MAG: adenylate/guanylate cyclase domain-containing protein [Bacteroidales bacterium]|nr:adenylate/guanylate cyclase domain-containing protein [Bacteroidales bacterium]
MKKYFIIIFLFLCVCNAFSQSYETGIPGFKNYSPKDYGQESQNFSVIQDNNSIMYFGNANGIMEFDNLNWNLVKVTGRPVMDVNKKNQVFFGGYNQIGQIVYKNGQPRAKLFNFHEEYKPGQIKKVATIDDVVLFASSHQLLIYKNDSVEIEHSNAPGIDLFKFNDKVLIYLPGRGLFYWYNNKITKYKDFDLFKDIEIEDIIPLNEQDFLIKPANQKGFIKYSKGKTELFLTEADDFLSSNIYSKGVLLDNNRIIFGTLHGGLVCIDIHGHYLFSLNRESGLRDNQITDIFVSNDGRLWVTTYNGICLVETQSDISFFDSSFGFSGAILTILRYNGTLYIGTANGVYKYKEGNIYDNILNIFDFRIRFEKIDGIRAMCWKLTIINNELFAITNDGIYKVYNNSCKQILKGSYNTIVPMTYYPDTYLIGSNQGLIISKYNSYSIDTIGTLQNFNYNIRTICEDYFGNYWLGTNEDGLYQTNFFNGLSTQSEIVHYTSKEGLPEEFDWVDVFPSFHGIIFSTSKGAYHYNYQSNIFEKDSLFGFDFSDNNLYVYPLIEDSKNNIYYSCVHEGKYERETGKLVFNGANKKYTRLYKPFTQLREFVIETIYPENNGDVWFGSSDALIKYDPKDKSKNTIKYNCLIRSIVIHNDSTIFFTADKTNINNKLQINFSDKTIRFNFSALCYNTLGNTVYQVMLVGFDDDWSDWTNETFKEYTSLVENEYTFKVRAKDIYGNVSEEASITFIVKPPFYRTWYAFLIYVIVFAAIIYLILKLNELRHAKERYSLEKLVEDRTNELAYQKEQTEQLVKKLLPQNAADELRETGKAKSQKYELVTVLFADIQGFTEIAEHTKPEELIKHLNNIFISFDKLIAKYNIEKIKTIGDAYMCAGGMPNKDNTNPIEVVMAALEMQREIRRINETSSLKLEIRIGVHTGPVVAGVVGSKKLEYDIWGDTVNIASRMESHGLINKVNISEHTYNMVKDFFVCQYRGKIEVKYKGEMEMYFVHEIKKALSENADRITPNKDFFIKLQFIKFKAIQEEILDQLQRNLPSNLYYHNLKHTINVLYITEEIAREEGVDEEEMLLLKCAALFHDAGFMVSYDNNEEIGAKMAAQTLQRYKFGEIQIETIKRLILATKMPPKPKDLLEKIICDADLDYLGRPDFIPISQNLFRELFERGKINTIEQWNKMQYKFILSHNYFTTTARKNRDAGKQAVIAELKEMI